MLEQKTNNLPKVVVGGLIYQNEKILICQRKEEGDHPLKWEFPGGKLKDSENNKEALKRELKEELNINVSVAHEVKNFHYQYTNLSIYFSVWHVTEFRGNPIGNEWQAVVWSPCSELNQYTFPAANTIILNWVFQNICIR